jgi:hypothetical protein
MVKFRRASLQIAFEHYYSDSMTLAGILTFFFLGEQYLGSA